MSDKKFIAVLKELSSQMRFFNTQIKSINETLDKTLLLFRKLDEQFPVPQETLSK